MRGRSLRLEIADEWWPALRLLGWSLLFVVVCPPFLVLFAATDNVERYAVEQLPPDDRALSSWYQDHGARWVVVERVGAGTVNVEFRARGLLRRGQPPLEELGYGPSYLMGFERTSRFWKSLLPLVMAVWICWWVARRTFRVLPGRSAPTRA